MYVSYNIAKTINQLKVGLKFEVHFFLLEVHFFCWALKRWNHHVKSGKTAPQYSADLATLVGGASSENSSLHCLLIFFSPLNFEMSVPRYIQWWRWDHRTFTRAAVTTLICFCFEKPVSFKQKTHKKWNLAAATIWLYFSFPWPINVTFTDEGYIHTLQTIWDYQSEKKEARKAKASATPLVEQWQTSVSIIFSLPCRNGTHALPFSHLSLTIHLQFTLVGKTVGIFKIFASRPREKTSSSDLFFFARKRALLL